jgi:hypothetical protein
LGIADFGGLRRGFLLRYDVVEELFKVLVFFERFGEDQGSVRGACRGVCVAVPRPASSASEKALNNK